MARRPPMPAPQTLRSRLDQRPRRLTATRAVRHAVVSQQELLQVLDPKDAADALEERDPGRCRRSVSSDRGLSARPEVAPHDRSGEGLRDHAR